MSHSWEKWLEDGDADSQEVEFKNKLKKKRAIAKLARERRENGLARDRFDRRQSDTSHQ